jgi:hypothetical protein
MRMLIDLFLTQEHTESLTLHIHGQSHVLLGGLQRSPETSLQGR